MMPIFFYQFRAGMKFGTHIAVIKKIIQHLLS